MPRKATARQVAARRNRARWAGHTPAGLERLRRAALEREPWKQSTGPRTAAGKARSSQNALVHGVRAAVHLPEPVKRFVAELAAAERGGPTPEHDLARAMLDYYMDTYKAAGLARGASLYLRYARLCRRRLPFPVGA